ncbi:hypothetical protein [Endozoicomonas sp. 8E]|uniref:hypothetical protein n=1 Tax=Endozoicomonas sp. 8E TaxID=3035692 RepID=UPI002938FF0F|nr:hypothetical protein [Endozoicomonas sp. 8E]WOG28878.1 hypothetical protein P6910_04235 [Endozoicomonas sp. 8E]
MITLNKTQAINLADSIVSLDSRGKQEIGRRFAYRLGFTPGPLGPDDGIDGEFLYNGLFCHFQSKMSRTPLDKDEARKYYSDIKAHKAEWSIMLSGFGFKDTFYSRLDMHDDLQRDKIYLLTLVDVFTKSELFLQAANNIPPLFNITSIDWSNY